MPGLEPSRLIPQCPPRYWYNKQNNQTTWTEPPEVTAFKRRADYEASQQVRRLQQQAAEQRAAAKRQLVGTLGAQQQAMPTAEELRRAAVQQAIAARAGGAFGGAGGAGGAAGGREARVAGFKALLADSGVNAFSFFDKIRRQLEGDQRCATA